MTTDQPSKRSIVALSLNGGRVTRGFRDELFDASARAGISVNEFVLLATGEKLTAQGRDFPGVFNAEKPTSAEPAYRGKPRSTVPTVKQGSAADE